MKMIPIPASQLRNQIVDIREAIIRDDKIFEITDNGKPTGVLLVARSNFEELTRKEKPNFRKLASKTKSIFEAQYPGMSGAKVARILRNSTYRYQPK